MTAILPAPPPRRTLLEQIDRLDASADAKVLLAQLVDATARVGEELVAVGHHVVAFVFETVRLFPHMALGIIVGFVMSWLVATAAVVGVILGPLLGPLLLAFGLGAGAIMDVRDGQFRERVERWAASFPTPTRR